MSKERRREIARAFKERPDRVGVYAVTCTRHATVWLGTTRHLDSQKNRLWFQLGAGTHVNQELQKAWATCGESHFQYEILEEVEDDNPLLLEDLARQRMSHWQEVLKAKPVLG